MPQKRLVMARRRILSAGEWAVLGGAALFLLGASKGQILTLAQMRDLATRAGFPDPVLAAAVAMAESGGRASVVGPTGDYGLWQIHVAAHPQYTPAALLNPEYNALAALDISKRGTDWTPWATFNKGLHLRWMPKA